VRNLKINYFCEFFIIILIIILVVSATITVLAWKARVLPLNYARICRRFILFTVYKTGILAP